MKSRSIFFLFFAAVLAVVFLFLDQGLSGASATNPGYVILFLAVCAGLAILVLSGRANGLAAGLNWLIGAVPILLMIFYLRGDWLWKNREDNAGNRSVAENIRCAAQKAGIAQSDQKMVKAWTGIIAMEGDAGGSSQREIENRLRIRVLPDCRFERF